MKCHYRNVKATAKIYNLLIMFFSSSKPLFSRFIDLSTYIYSPFLWTIRLPFTVTHMACQLYFIILSLYMRRTKCSQNLNGLSIVFYRFHSPYTQHTKLSQTTTQCEARSGSPQQERFVRMEINFTLGKNGGYMLSSLGGRSISVGRQAGSE